MIKGFKARLYPTKEQEQKMWEHINASRFVYNYMLKLNNDRYEHKDELKAKGEKVHLYAFDMGRVLTELRRTEDYEWLNGISRKTLEAVCSDLDNAFKTFFKTNVGYPQFKKRSKSKDAFATNYDNVYFTDRVVNIEKIGKVKYKTDAPITVVDKKPQRKKGEKKSYSNPRIVFENNKWFLTFGMEIESPKNEHTDSNVGIDLGIKELAIVAFDDHFDHYRNINKDRTVIEIEKRIKHLQRSISRKYEQNKYAPTTDEEKKKVARQIRGAIQGCDKSKFKKCGRHLTDVEKQKITEKNSYIYVKTSNIIREEKEKARLDARLKGIRDNYIHQTTNTIVKQMPKTITMENLNVKGMMKNKHLSKAIQDQGFYTFKQRIKYKSEFNGIEFKEVPRFYPSSKTCSCCGNVKNDLTLKDRVYICPVCGKEIDRDENAAINLRDYFNK